MEDVNEREREEKNVEEKIVKRKGREETKAVDVDNEGKEDRM